MMTRRSVLRALLALVCVSHLVLGVIAFASSPGPVTDAIAAVYGASMTLTPEMQHVIRILGAYLITIGVLGGFAFVNPQRNRAVIQAVVLLLVLRVSQRIIFARAIQEAFGISLGRLWFQSAFFLTLAAALFFLRPKKEGTEQV